MMITRLNVNGEKPKILTKHNRQSRKTFIFKLKVLNERINGSIKM